MSDRDELAEAISDRSDYEGFPPADEIADFLWSVGWRKKPSREAIAAAIALAVDDVDDLDSEPEDYRVEMFDGAYAVLALMDGPTETGDSDVC